MTILDEIHAHKQVEVARRKQKRSLADLERALEAAPTAEGPDFIAALRDRQRATGRPALIAEIKRASPSRGFLLPGVDALVLGQVYQQNGAAALSVLTDEKYFHGSLEDLQRLACAGLGLPVLCKDFILDEYQILEARLAGAQAILLIAAMLPGKRLCALQRCAGELGLAVLVEVHNLSELQAALECQPCLVGINNRDLHTFTTSLQTTLDLAQHVPNGVTLVAESGIRTPEDVTCLAQAGVQAILVGEALVTAPDVAAKVRSLAG